MIRIQIGNSERTINNIEDYWITQQIQGHISEGSSPCVKIFIKHEDIDLVLSSPSCTKQLSSNSRKPRHRENCIFDLWEQLGLDKTPTTSSALIAFFRQLRSIL